MKRSLNVTLMYVAALIGVAGCSDTNDSQRAFLDREKIELLRQSQEPVPLAELLREPERVSTVCELVPYTPKLKHHPELQAEIEEAGILPVPEHLWRFAFFSPSNEYLGFEEIMRHRGEIRHINKNKGADYHCSPVIGGKMLIGYGDGYIDIGLMQYD